MIFVLLVKAFGFLNLRVAFLSLFLVFKLLKYFLIRMFNFGGMLS